MKNNVLIAVLLMVSASSLQAEDAKSIKPGLWEIQQKAAVDGKALPDMNEMLAQVPPEMREQVAAMMAKNGAGMTNKGVTVCITPEQAASQQYGSDPESECQMSDIKQDGNVTHMRIQCSQPKGHGETTVTRNSAESWSSVSTMTVEENGASHTMHSEAAAHWLKSDCGAVKPAKQ